MQPTASYRVVRIIAVRPCANSKINDLVTLPPRHVDKRRQYFSNNLFPFFPIFHSQTWCGQSNEVRGSAAENRLECATGRVHTAGDLITSACRSARRRVFTLAFVFFCLGKNIKFDSTNSFIIDCEVAVS